MYFNTPAPASLRQVLDLTQPTRFRFNVYEKSGLIGRTQNADKQA